MLASTVPTLVPVPFASGAGAGFINPIPIPSQIVGGSDPGLASMTDGFPPRTFIPEGSGGLPPRGQDFNGILNLHSTAIQWSQMGCDYVYNSAFQTSIGGYPKGAVLARSNLSGGWISTVDNNVTNPEALGSGWLPYGGNAIANVTMTSGNVTLTALQAACNIIIITGALTANISLLFPAWAGVEWLIINRATGNFSIIARVTGGGGSGVAISPGNFVAYGTGTDMAGYTVVDNGSVVHTTGNETVGGTKTFTSNVVTTQAFVGPSATVISSSSTGGTVVCRPNGPASSVGQSLLDATGAVSYGGSITTGGTLFVNDTVNSSTSTLVLTVNTPGDIYQRPHGKANTTGQTHLDSSGNFSVSAALSCVTFNASGSDIRLKDKVVPFEPRPLHRLLTEIDDSHGPMTQYIHRVDGQTRHGPIAGDVKRVAPSYMGTLVLQDGQVPGVEAGIYDTVDKASLAYEEAMWSGLEIDRLLKRIDRLESLISP